MKIKAEEAIKPMPDKYTIQNEDAVDKSSDDPLSILKVFERLEVGPVKLEPRRLIAPYRLFYNGTMEQTELIYSYEETVFDPAELESQNLANMIAAQVALNYGLFCDAIVFHGLYDNIDRRFIRDMAENTARIMGLFPRKGRLDSGSDADLVVFDPTESWTVSASNQHSNASYTLFEGQELLGRVKKVLSRGRLVVNGEEFLGSEGYGVFLPSKAGNWQYRK